MNTRCFKNMFEIMSDLKIGAKCKKKSVIAAMSDKIEMKLINLPPNFGYMSLFD